MKGHFEDVTQMYVGYMWRVIGKMTKERTSYMWNVARNSNLNFIKNTHPHPVVVLWIRIGGVKHMRHNVPADHLTGPCLPSDRIPTKKSLV